MVSIKIKLLRHLLPVSIATFLLVATACSSSQKASGDSSSAAMTSQTLLQRLRKEPNVRVSGTEDNATIYINNIQGVTGGKQGEPLFVLNGSPIGYNYNQAYQVVQGKEIESVKVLKSTVATVQYGERASNGAVVIRTKDAK